jgi:hypothetical protein
MVPPKRRTPPIPLLEFAAVIGMVNFHGGLGGSRLLIACNDFRGSGR